MMVAELYHNRWQIELFFKWLKQHLKIKKFWGGSEKSERSDEISVGVYLEPIYKPYRKIVSYLQGIISTKSTSQNIVAFKIGRGQQSRKTKSGFQQKVMAQAICQDRNCIYGNGRLANTFLLRNKLETTFYPRSETSKTDKSPTYIWI